MAAVLRLCLNILWLAGAATSLVLLLESSRCILGRYVRLREEFAGFANLLQRRCMSSVQSYRCTLLHETLVSSLSQYSVIRCDASRCRLPLSNALTLGLPVTSWGKFQVPCTRAPFCLLHSRFFAPAWFHALVVHRTCCSNVYASVCVLSCFWHGRSMKSSKLAQ